MDPLTLIYLVVGGLSLVVLLVSVVIGDIAADVGAAHAAGGRAVLVPTPVTREEEVAAAPAVAADLAEAVRIALAGDAG